MLELGERRAGLLFPTNLTPDLELIRLLYVAPKERVELFRLGSRSVARQAIPRPVEARTMIMV